MQAKHTKESLSDEFLVVYTQEFHVKFKLYSLALIFQIQ